MSTVTDINTNFTEVSLEDRMSGLTFHIVGRLVEVTNSRNVSFFLFAKYSSMVVNDNSCIMKSLFVFLSLKDRRHDHHVILLG